MRMKTPEELRMNFFSRWKVSDLSRKSNTNKLIKPWKGQPLLPARIDHGILTLLCSEGKYWILIRLSHFYFRCRFQKKLYIPLPNELGRRELIK